jgi:hypothetical protein
VTYVFEVLDALDRAELLTFHQHRILSPSRPLRNPSLDPILISKLNVVMTFAAVGLATGCAVRSVRVETMTPSAAVGIDVTSPLKAFHDDGTITVFRLGAQVTQESVVGEGMHYSLDLADSVAVLEIPVAGIVGIEFFRGEDDGGQALAIAAATGAGIGVAIFMALGAAVASIFVF